MNRNLMRMRVGALTHAGRVRDHNEDCMGICEWVRARPMESPVIIDCALDEPRICVIADGVGGHAGGETASSMTVRGLISAVAQMAGDEDVGVAIARVNDRIFQAMKTTPDLVGMGSTVVGVVTFCGELCLFNVGDSRGYLRVGNFLRLLTTDDTSRFSASDVSERTGQQDHSITQALGGRTSFTEIAPHLLHRPIEPGDRYLLCSDGLTDMLDLDAIEACLVDDVEESTTRLVEAALAAGGADNLSVMIIDFTADVVRHPDA